MLKKTRILSCVFLATAYGYSQAVENRVKEELPELVTIYKHLHAHPELSYYEKETAAYLAGELRSLGFAVTEQVGLYNDPEKVSYGLVGVLQNGEGPTVMVRTDLDALPVEEKTGLPYASQAMAVNENGEQVRVMHACGHDVHMTSFLGTARMLVAMKDSWRGTLVMIGQPAEERGAGARAMLADGLFTRFPKPDYVLALHAAATLPAGKIGHRPEYALANVDSVDITIRGAGGHGAWPHTTKDPIVLASQVVLGLQTIVSRQISPLDPAVVTVGSIHGGTKHNVIPDEVHLQLTVRSYKPEVRKHILDSIRQMTLGIAEAAGFPKERSPIVQVDEEEYTPATYNDPELNQRLVETFRAALGAENVVQVEPVMGGEDFGRYSLEGREIPSVIFWLGAVNPALLDEHQQTGTPLPSLHSSQFAPLPEPAIRTGVIAMTSAVLDLMK